MSEQTTTISILANRYSRPLLETPAPAEEHILQAYEAMMRAPDHARLKPVRIQVWEGDGLLRMGEVFADYARRQDPQATREVLEKARTRPLRAPMIITVVVKYTEHPKVPEIEQIITGGCAAYALMLSLDSLGFGTMWRTGDIAYDQQAKEQLGLATDEHLIGFIYTGTPADVAVKTVQAPPCEERISFIRR